MSKYLKVGLYIVSFVVAGVLLNKYVINRPVVSLPEVTDQANLAQPEQAGISGNATRGNGTAAYDK
jgi:hypothetical protein